jgi:hypothetical protein
VSLLFCCPRPSKFPYRRPLPALALEPWRERAKLLVLIEGWRKMLCSTLLLEALRARCLASDGGSPLSGAGSAASVVAVG